MMNWVFNVIMKTKLIKSYIDLRGQQKFIKAQKKLSIIYDTIFKSNETFILKVSFSFDKTFNFDKKTENAEFCDI